VLVVTMTLSDLMNNAATAAVMCPIAIGTAQQLGASADPFLMAVAVGASCAFLTPIGHQNNTLILGARAAASASATTGGWGCLPPTGGDVQTERARRMVAMPMLMTGKRILGVAARPRGTQFASVEIGNCRAFGNRNGKLFCESPGDGSGSNGRLGPWGGSFHQSCRDASVDKQGKLQATCRKDNGTYKRSNLQAHKCPGFRAGNRNGDLFCESDGTSSGAGHWGGSFSQSCRDVSTDANGVLTATCQTMSGRWNRTSLSAAQCSRRKAGNRDGTLFCEQ
jgi:hypothetical protein